jgi:nucleoside-diphosphate-sugar epimerase
MLGRRRLPGTFVRYLSAAKGDMMKALIIGGTSSLGCALKPVLSEFSEVITAGREDCDITLDLNGPIEKISFPDNVDVVIHTAAHFGGETVDELLEAESVNVLGTLKLCHVSVQSKIGHFVLISSMFICLKEDSRYYNMYALSKKQAEEVAIFYCSRHSLPLTILRPSQIYGSAESFRRHQPFLYAMVDNAEKGEGIVIYGSNDAQRNYIHIDDLTNIISKVVRKRVQGTYSCMYTKNITYSQIAEAALSAFNSKGSIRYLRDKNDIPDNVFDIDDALYKIIEFYPQISIEEGMRRIARYRGVRL